MSSEEVTKDEAQQVQAEELKQTQAEESSSELEDSELEAVAGGSATQDADERNERYGRR